MGRALKRIRSKKLLALKAAAALLCAAQAFAARAAGEIEVTQLSIEDLMKIEVISVSRKSQRLTDTAAAAFVITADEVRRSGATSIPDALRMVPGLDVAQVGAAHWAVSARGFNGRFAQKLLVLVDGRSVYSPLFSGVFWEAEDVMLEDLDRIEVIRGSGAALWGANAVNGVINIITKKAQATQGSLLAGHAGNVEKGTVAGRFGGKVDDNTYFRVWAKGSSRAESQDVDGSGGNDAARAARAGLRFDRDMPDGSRLSVMGGVSRKTTGEVVYAPSLVAPYTVPTPVRQLNEGGNLLGRYDWTIVGGSQATLQSYVEQSKFDEQLVKETRTNFDLDFQNRIVFPSGHDVIWGAGYRRSQDKITMSDSFVQLSPERRTFESFSLFAHDEIELAPEKWRLVLGSKFEHNSYTGLEVQPNLRLLWTPAPATTLWAAASNAARTPSRAERDATVLLGVTPPESALNPGPLPVVVVAVPNQSLKSERVLACELGYRAQLSSSLSIDVAAFHNAYKDLRSGTTIGPMPVLTGPIPYIAYGMQTSNALRATSHGLEIAADWHPESWWRLQGAYTYFRVKGERNGDPANDGSAAELEGSAPQHQASIRSSVNVGRTQQFDAWVRRVGALAYSQVSAYTALDLRYAWRVSPQLEFSLVGQNLLSSQHTEFVSDLLPSKRLDVSRSAYARVRWQF